MDVDSQLIYEEYLREDFRTWIKTAIIGTLIGTNVGCITSPNSPGCDTRQMRQGIAREDWINPWFGYKHQWLWHAGPREDYPERLIKDIKATLKTEPPDPRKYTQDHKGRVLFMKDLTKWYEYISTNYDLKGWYNNYAL